MDAEGRLMRTRTVVRASGLKDRLEDSHQIRLQARALIQSNRELRAELAEKVRQIRLICKRAREQLAGASHEVL